VAEALATGLIDLLLDLQPHSYAELVRDARAAAKSTRIKVVADYLEGHLDEPLRIGTLAGVAGCSIRSLQSTFLEHCGCTPMEFVKRRRLARARQLLESAHRDTTVTQAALAAGFSHLGKFSQSYQEFYGERPSETLRRAMPAEPPRYRKPLTGGRIA
jgi:transcriptional regulator GlxA family with amidase domain